MCVFICVCACSVIYSEARSASSCPNGVPMTLPAADLHHGETEEGRDGEILGGRGRRAGGEIRIVEKSTSFSIC